MTMNIRPKTPSEYSAIGTHLKEAIAQVNKTAFGQ